METWIFPKIRFSTFFRWMSSSKYEFLHVRTHPFDVNWYSLNNIDTAMKIYGLWKKSWKFGFSEKEFPRAKISIFEKSYRLKIMIVLLFLGVENDHISFQNFSAPLIWPSHQYPLIFLKVVKNRISTFGLHGRGVLQDEFLRSAKFFHQKVWNQEIIFHILVVSHISKT